MAITSIKIGDKTFDIDYSKHNHTRSQITDVKSLKFGSKTYDGSAEKEITAADLGLGAALKFVGTATTALTDGSTTTSVALSSGSTLTVSSTSNIGSVVFYGNKEFVWNGSSWEELGYPIDLSNYKTKQTAVSSPSASGNATAFIDSISQDANGNITVTKKNVSFPTIPTKVSDLTNDSGFTSNAGTVTGVKINGSTKSPSSGVVDLGTVITSHQDISGKADKSSLSTVATSGSYNDLSDKPTIPSAVTSSTVSGWGFTKNTGTITGIKMNGTSKGTSGVVNLGTVITSLDGYATQSWVEGKGYKTTDNDTKNTAGSSNKTGTKLLIVGATSTTTGTTYTNSNCYVGTDNCLYSGGTKVLTSHQDISGKADKSSLSTVATSGSYNDLTNKPTIPAAVTSSTVSGWGFTKNAGTVTSVKINGSTKSPSNGVVDLGTVITSHQDISGKADKSSLSTVATSGSYNDLTNKPTIPAAYKGNYSTSTLTASSKSFTLNPNTYYTFTPSSASTRTFSFGSATSGIVNEYIVEINMSSYAPTIAFPSSVVWANGAAPAYAKGKKYIISIVNNYAVFAEF